MENTTNERIVNKKLEELKELKEQCWEILNELKLESIYVMTHYDVKEQWIDEMRKDAEEQINKRGINDFKLSYELTPLQKLCCYRVSNKNVDCDVALRNMIINFLAYDFEDEELYIRLQTGDKYCIEGMGCEWIWTGDTMNSYATPIVEHFFWAKWTGADFYSYLKEKGVFKEVKDKKGYFSPLFESFRDNQRRSAAILCEYNYFEEKLECIDLQNAMKYMEFVHTLGNCLLVPLKKGNSSFNRQRGLCSTKDYWDLALEKIYDWYSDGHKDEHIKQIVGKEEKDIKLCKDWLNSFEGGWEGFLNKNMMKGFVDENNKPVLFWDGHDINKVCPNKSDLEKFFENSCKGIEKRGKEIAEKIHKKLEKMDEYGLDELADRMVGL